MSKDKFKIRRGHHKSKSTHFMIKTARVARESPFERKLDFVTERRFPGHSETEKSELDDIDDGEMKSVRSKSYASLINKSKTKSSFWLRNKKSTILPSVNNKSSKFLKRRNKSMNAKLNKFTTVIREDTEDVFFADRWVESKKYGKNLTPPDPANLTFF